MSLAKTIEKKVFNGKNKKNMFHFAVAAEKKL